MRHNGSGWRRNDFQELRLGSLNFAGFRIPASFLSSEARHVLSSQNSKEVQEKNKF